MPRTDRYLVATAYFAKSTRTVAQMAAVLGRTDDEAHYVALADEIDAAFAAEYVLPDGRMTSDAQTAYALAIAFDLIPDAVRRDAAGERLAELVREARQPHRDRASSARPLVSDALTRTGHLDKAYDLLLEQDCPSWLYQVVMGATTVWERWDSLLPDGNVNPGTMTSFNHYALGAVADWLHRVVGGLAPAAPGYRVVRFAPQPGGGLTSASARHRDALRRGVDLVAHRGRSARRRRPRAGRRDGHARAAGPACRDPRARQHHRETAVIASPSARHPRAIVLTLAPRFGYSELNRFTSFDDLNEEPP